MNFQRIRALALGAAAGWVALACQATPTEPEALPEIRYYMIADT